MKIFQWRELHWRDLHEVFRDEKFFNEFFSSFVELCIFIVTSELLNFRVLAERNQNIKPSEKEPCWVSFRWRWSNCISSKTRGTGSGNPQRSRRKIEISLREWRDTFLSPEEDLHLGWDGNSKFLLFVHCRNEASGNKKRRRKRVCFRSGRFVDLSAFEGREMAKVQRGDWKLGSE